MDQLFCEPADCPTFIVPGTGGGLPVDRYSYVADLMQTTVGRRWFEWGMAAAIVAALVGVAVFALQFVDHQRR